MKYFGLLLACLSAMPLGAQAGELFRWVDKAGKVHYGDTKPADVADVETKNLSGSVSQNEDLPYETRRAQQSFPVALYVTSGCGAPCDQARSMLNKRGIPFSEKMLKTQDDINEFYKTTGSNGAPTLSIGKNFLTGFQESRWNNELDVAGYPKTATYRQRIAPTKKPPVSENTPDEEQAAPAEPAEPAEPPAQ